MKDTQNLENLIRETVEKILFFIGVVASVDVVADVSEENTFHINLSGDDLGVVIGYHGEGLASLQHILNLIVGTSSEKWPHLIVDVNGYRRDREEKVKEMTKGAIDRVKFSMRPVELPPMVAFDRRIAHLVVSETEGVASESVGVGYNRRVVITPKQDEE